MSGAARPELSDVTSQPLRTRHVSVWPDFEQSFVRGRIPPPNAATRSLVSRSCTSGLDYRCSVHRSQSLSCSHPCPPQRHPRRFLNSSEPSGRHVTMRFWWKHASSGASFVNCTDLHGCRPEFLTRMYWSLALTTFALWLTPTSWV